MSEALRAQMQHYLGRTVWLENEVNLLKKRIEELEPAAECWAALSEVARMRMVGGAGIHPDSPYYNKPYAYITMEFWTHHPAKGDEEDKKGREFFCDFMKKALDLHRKAKVVLTGVEE